MQLTASGSDSLGNWEARIPGWCPRCNDGVEVSIHYNSAAAVNKALKALGINPVTPSLLLKKERELGLTCGCYATFQRQVAHIGQKREKARAG